MTRLGQSIKLDHHIKRTKHSLLQNIEYPMLKFDMHAKKNPNSSNHKIKEQTNHTKTQKLDQKKN